MMAQSGYTGRAAKVCNDYSIQTENGVTYDDWFLPSKDALNQMDVNKTQLEASPGFVAFSNYYWSSTEYDSSVTWVQVFSNGSQASGSKGNLMSKTRNKQIATS